MKAIVLAAMLTLAAMPLSARSPHTPANPQPAPGGGPMTVYENGDSDILEECAHEFTLWTKADDFILPSDGYVNGAEVDWAVPFGGSWDGTINWGVYLNAGGFPGAAVATGVAHNLVTTSLGSSPNADWYNSSFDFGQQLVIAGNTRYWFALHFSSDCTTRDDVYWGCSTNQAGFFTSEIYQCNLPWFQISTLPLNRDHAFSLGGDFLIATEETTWGAIKNLYSAE